MGWTSYQATMYKNGKVDRKGELDNIFNSELVDYKTNEKTGFLKILKSTIIGTTYYAAIGHYNLNEELQKVFGVIALTSVNNKDWYNFSYKDMDETEGPYQCKCPLSILNLLSETDNEFALNWRKKVREYHANKNKSEFNLGKLKVGSIIQIEYNSLCLKFERQFGCIHKFSKYDVNHKLIDYGIKKIDKIWSCKNGFYNTSTRVLNSYFKQGKVKILKETSAKEEKELREIRIQGVQ